MKSWKLTFPLRRCPHCGRSIRATFTGYLRFRETARRGTVGEEGYQEPTDGEDP